MKLYVEFFSFSSAFAASKILGLEFEAENTALKVVYYLNMHKYTTTLVSYLS